MHGCLVCACQAHAVQVDFGAVPYVGLCCRAVLQGCIAGLFCRAVLQGCQPTALLRGDPRSASRRWPPTTKLLTESAPKAISATRDWWCSFVLRACMTPGASITAPACYTAVMPMRLCFQHAHAMLPWLLARLPTAPRYLLVLCAPGVVEGGRCQAAGWPDTQLGRH